MNEHFSPSCSLFIDMPVYTTKFPRHVDIFISKHNRRKIHFQCKYVSLSAAVSFTITQIGRIESKLDRMRS